jgi:hypothetical protein
MIIFFPQFVPHPQSPMDMAFEIFPLFHRTFFYLFLYYDIILILNIKEEVENEHFCGKVAICR